MAELMDPGGEYRLDFLRAGQLRHFLETMMPPTAANQTLTPLEELCSDRGMLPHAISLTHGLLSTPGERFQNPSLDTMGPGFELHIFCHKGTEHNQVHA